MGTRLYYEFFSEDMHDERLFSQRIDALIREIGERGRADGGVPESTPPVSARVMTAAPAPVLAPATGAARAALVPEATTPSQAETAALSFSPSLQHTSTPLPAANAAANSGGSLLEIMTLVEKQREYEDKLRKALHLKVDEVRQDAQRERDALLTKLHAAELRAVALEAQCRTHIEKQQDQVVAISEEQVTALSTRLETVRAAELLSDEEATALEDIVADFLETKASLVLDVVTADFVRTNDHARKLHTLVSLSKGLQNDKSFARQAIRKLVS